MVETSAIMTCPHCGVSYEVEMPTAYCQVALECEKCGERIDRKAEDCCVFCSYANRKCPSMQEV